MSEVIPEDEDRGGDGAIEGAVGGGGGVSDPTKDDDSDSETDSDNHGGHGPDDGGPGSQDM